MSSVFKRGFYLDANLFLVYIAYLFFQFWSHSHHFEDAVAPSHKLPNAVSMRSMASKVRPTSPAFRKLTSPGSTFASVFRSPRAPFAANPSEATLSGPYMYRKAAPASPTRSGILMTSPLGTTSQLTVTMPAQAEPTYSPNADAGASTVRLVSEVEHVSPMDEDSPSPCSSRSESPSPPHPADRASFVSDLVSSYYTDLDPMHERSTFAGSREGFYGKGIDPRSMRSRIQLCDEPKVLRRRTMQPSESMEDVVSSAEKPQLSLFLTLFLLLVVTVVRAMILNSSSRCSPY